MVVVSLIVSIYYNVIMAYTLFYMGVSFAKDVPWNKCYSWWNPGDNCYVRNESVVRIIIFKIISLPSNNNVH